jgi:hypothetical protein
MINFIPLINMSFKDKILAITNIIIFISLILSLITRNIAFILFGIIIIIFLYYIYLYNDKVIIDTNETLKNRNLSIVDNKLCVIPTIENPFMNPSIIDYTNNNNNIKSCPIDKDTINDNINNYFQQNVYKDINDIYEREFSARQFYTMPSTTIPNDRKSYENWLYYRGKTCKENNGVQCYNNIL